MKSSVRIYVTVFLGMLHQLSNALPQTECGIYNTKEKLLPWTANLYRLSDTGVHEFICLGTIISKSVVLTAARCFYDDIKQKRKSGTYFLSIGQQYQAWNGNLKQGVQRHELSFGDVILPTQYKGKNNNYADNIAIIKLVGNKKLNLNDFTKTVCLDWSNDLGETYLELQAPPLKSVTWSASKNGTFNLIQPTYVIYEKCFDLLPEDFQPFLTVDKICAQVEGVLQIPATGSGLYAFNKDKNRWFLLGIGCDIKTIGSKTLMIFTKIGSHLNWLSNSVFLLLDP